MSDNLNPSPKSYDITVTMVDGDCRKCVGCVNYSIYESGLLIVDDGQGAMMFNSHAWAKIYVVDTTPAKPAGSEKLQ